MTVGLGLFMGLGFGLFVGLGFGLGGDLGFGLPWVGLPCCRGYGLAFGLTVAWVLVSAWWWSRGFAVGLREHSEEENRNEEREKKDKIK